MDENMITEEVDRAVLEQDLLDLRKEARFFKELTMTRDGKVFDSTGAGGSMKDAWASILSMSETTERGFWVFKKKTHHRDTSIVIDGTDYALSIHVLAEEEDRARTWKSRFNSVAERMS